MGPVASDALVSAGRGPLVSTAIRPRWGRAESEVWGRLRAMNPSRVPTHLHTPTPRSAAETPWTHLGETRDISRSKDSR